MDESFLDSIQSQNCFKNAMVEVENVIFMSGVEVRDTLVSRNNTERDSQK